MTLNLFYVFTDEETKEVIASLPLEDTSHLLEVVEQVAAIKFGWA